MSTPADEALPHKHHTTAEIEAELAKAPHLTAPMTCQQMCDQIQHDMDIIDNLGELPVKVRARVHAAMVRAIAALNHQMTQQHCPHCAAPDEAKGG